ncbi:MAG: hypothetical protein JNK85_20075 [Verrucomicrobiales bacterium]|nr:hypothetical protein [Verrucomicrobiales bacterium]
MQTTYRLLTLSALMGVSWVPSAVAQIETQGPRDIPIPEGNVVWVLVGLAGIIGVQLFRRFRSR